MKKANIAFVAMIACVTTHVAMAAVTVKKAAPVATQAASSSSTTASLVPTVLGLVSNVQQLTAKQKALTDDCVPSSAEITFVDNIVKEWAKTGAMTAGEVQRRLKRDPCPGGNGYAYSVKENAATNMNNICYDAFVASGDVGQVWYAFPKVGKTEYCEDGSDTCKNKKTASDIYDIFNLVDFAEADYVKSDNPTMAAKLITKIENCSTAKLSQKKRAMWGEFLTTTMAGVGQKTNTGTIMDTVGNITKSGTNLTGGLSSLGSVATQFLNK